LRWRRELSLPNIALLIGIALLLLAFGNTWWGGASAPSRPRSAKGPEVPSAPILRDQQPLGSFAVVAAKNLFSQDRTGPSLGPTKGQNNLEGRQLLGIMIIGDTRAALIGGKTGPRAKGETDVEVVYLGEEWGGFKVVEISNDAIIFQGKDGRRTLNFPE
jgi:hypothetical protein